MDASVAWRITLVADLAVAVAYAVAGTLLVRRAYATSAPRAGTMFALWWFGNAATGLASVALVVLAGYAHVSLLILDLVEQSTLAFFASALVGFTSFVSYVYLGSFRMDRILVPTYGALVVWSVASVLLTPATGVALEGWRPHVVRATGFGPPIALTAALLLVPLVAALTAYAFLYRSAPDREARYRIVLVTGTLSAWLASIAILSLPGVGDAIGLQLAARGLILVSTILLVLAYRPAAPLRAWLKEPPQEVLAQRHAALVDRARRLI